MLTVSQRKLKMRKEKKTLKRLGLPEVTAPLEEGMPGLEGGATALLEGMDNIFVTTSTPDAVFASWSRIAATTGKVETMALPQEASGKPNIKVGSDSDEEISLIDINL